MTTLPTKTKLVDAIVGKLPQDQWIWYVGTRGKPDSYAPTEGDLRRCLMARNLRTLEDIHQSLS